jgi:hypothetical protein
MILRIADGKIVEHWGNDEAIGRKRHLGIIALRCFPRRSSLVRRGGEKIGGG